MRNFKFKLLLLIVVGNSCQNNRQDITSARSFYDSIQKEYSLNWAIQQPVIDSLVKVGIDMKNDPSAKIDSITFKEYIENSKLKNQETISKIGKINEVDEEISLKSKVLEHLLSISYFYDNGIPEFIKILNQDNKEKYKEAATLLLPKLKVLKEKELEYASAKNIFNSKYSRSE